jgi:hypothetical protein
MKKIIPLYCAIPIFLFGGVFEHLLNKDQNYLFKHNFRCHENICISPEKNIFDQKKINHATKLITVFLDHEKKVYKIEIELYVKDIEKNAFYSAVVQLAPKEKLISYSLEERDDKYGNHSLIIIIDVQREKKYMNFLTQEYKEIMNQYK